MRIRIKSMPRGEAPISVRSAWVGLSLPTVSGLVECPCVGVVSGTRPGIVGWLRRLIAGAPIERGYIVDAGDAVRLLAAEHPEAAAWWRENYRGRQLLFFQECCVVEAEPAAG